MWCPSRFGSASQLAQDINSERRSEFLSQSSPFRRLQSLAYGQFVCESPTHLFRSGNIRYFIYTDLIIGWAVVSGFPTLSLVSTLVLSASVPTNVFSDAKRLWRHHDRRLGWRERRLLHCEPDYSVRTPRQSRRHWEFQLRSRQFFTASTTSSTRQCRNGRFIAWATPNCTQRETE